MATSLSRMLDRFTPSLDGNGIIRIIEPLANRQPGAYLAVVTLFAVLGYLLLLLFPLLALSTLADLPQQFRHAAQWQDWLWLGTDVLIVVAAVAFSVPLFTSRFEPPRGLEINPENAPGLCQLIDELRQEYKQPVIDRIILQEGFMVDITRTPRRGLPILYINTLVIGLDALICLPAEHFRTLLGRRIGQLSATHSRFIGWLAWLRQDWRQYHQGFKQQKLPLAWPLQFIFAIFAPFYAGVSFYVARQNEIEADNYALDITNNDDVASLFSQLIVTQSFLDEKFWPKIKQIARRSNSQPEHLPYSSMINVLRRGLTREDMQSWIKNAFDTISDRSSTTPLLRSRLENIGHHKPASPTPIKATAADKYIDPRVMEKIISKFDQRWLAQVTQRRPQ